VLERLTRFALDRPKTVIAATVVLTVVFGLQFSRITIDTDPENMLEADQPDRVFYNRVKKDFGVHDLVVVGIVDERGVFRPESLKRISRTTSEILKIPGVVIPDVVSLTTTNNVTSSGGLLDIHPVMGEVPRTPEGIESLRRDIAENPFLHEKIASADGTAVAIYVPVGSKDQSYRIASEIKAILDRELLPGQTYHLNLVLHENESAYKTRSAMDSMRTIGSSFANSSGWITRGTESSLSAPWTLPEATNRR